MKQQELVKMNLVVVLLVFASVSFAYGSQSKGQQVLLESTLVRCSHDEMVEDGTPKNPLWLASSFKSHPKLDLKLYSKCRKKLLITLRVTETSKAFVPDAIVLIDKAKNSLTQKSSRFGLPVAVKFHQEALLQKYDLKYLYRVNGKMYEEVINLENNKSFNGCVDSIRDGSNEPPSCGYVPGKTPKQVAGFCCTCKDHRNQVQQRGGQRCDIPHKTPAQLTSAHCLRSSPFWYNVYEISSPTLYQKMRFEIFKGREHKNGTIFWERMAGNPKGVSVDSEHPLNADGPMKVTYRPHVEGISNSAMLFDFKKQRLLFPLQNPFVVGDQSPDPEPLKGFVEDQVLIVPKSLMSPLGATCDHSGTHIDAFINQPEACRVERGSCLNNQPFDLWKRDQGPHGDPNSRFRLTSYQTEYTPLLDFAEDYKSGSVYVAHRADAPTYVDIEIPADDIIILAPGYNAVIESILTDTGSEGAKVVVQIFNKELVEASFAVELVQCSLNFTQSSSGLELNVEMKSPSKKIGPLNGRYFHLDLHSYAMKIPVYCYLVLVNEFGESVAAREIILKPFTTCLCVHTCKCACGDNSNLQCENMSEESIIASGLISTIQTTEQLKEEEENHFSQKYRWIFHWLLVIHVILLVVGCCGWLHKKSSKTEETKRRYVTESDESLDYSSNSDSVSYYGSEITLYDKTHHRGGDNFEEASSKYHRKGNPSPRMPNPENTSWDSEFSQRGVTFASTHQIKPPSTVSSAATMTNMNISGDSKNSDYKTTYVYSNKSQNVVDAASQVESGGMSTLVVPSQVSRAATPTNNMSNQASNTAHANHQVMSNHQSVNSPRTTTSAVYPPSATPQANQNTQRYGNGPQAVESESTEMWTNQEETEQNLENFLHFCASTSSSKTSFGTWNRRKRDQYSAYDFLPEAKQKASFT